MTEPAETPELYVVAEAFVTEVDGAPVVYAKGELVHPADPFLAAMPERFRPFTFPHQPRVLAAVRPTRTGVRAAKGGA